VCHPYIFALRQSRPTDVYLSHQEPGAWLPTLRPGDHGTGGGTALIIVAYAGSAALHAHPKGQYNLILPRGRNRRFGMSSRATRQRDASHRVKDTHPLCPAYAPLRVHHLAISAAASCRCPAAPTNDAAHAGSLWRFSDSRYFIFTRRMRSTDRSSRS